MGKFERVFGFMFGWLVGFLVTEVTPDHRVKESALESTDTCPQIKVLFYSRGKLGEPGILFAASFINLPNKLD